LLRFRDIKVKVTYIRLQSLYTVLYVVKGYSVGWEHVSEIEGKTGFVFVIGC